MAEITRETLELAALAAGIKADQSKRNGGPPRNDGFDIAGNLVTDWHSGTVWRPHLDDGDSRRLQVALVMHLQLGSIRNMHFASVSIPSRLDSNYAFSAQHDGTPVDAARAAREAVVLCAAEVGRRMREGER